MPAYRQKYSTAGREVVLPRMKAKKFVNDVSGRCAQKGQMMAERGREQGAERRNHKTCIN